MCWSAVAKAGRADRDAGLRRSKTCTEAALNLKHGTMDVRSPDSSILPDVRLQCASQTWPADARACFTEMQPGDLGRCATKLSDRSHATRCSRCLPKPVTRTIARRSTSPKRGSTRCVSTSPECDQFLGAVRGVIACEALPAGTRARTRPRRLGHVVAADAEPARVRRAPDGAGVQRAQLAKLKQLGSCKP